MSPSTRRKPPKQSRPRSEAERLRDELALAIRQGNHEAAAALRRRLNGAKIERDVATWPPVDEWPESVKQELLAALSQAGAA